MRHSLLLAALLVASCAKWSDEAKPQPAATTRAAVEARDTAEPPAGTRKIIHTGSLRLTIESYESTRQEIESLVTAAGGFVGSTRVEHGGGKVESADLTLRIPSAKFPEILARLRQLGRVVDESTHAEDVTEAWVDLEARIRNARQMETRLIEIVARGPEKVADLLEVERELGRVRGEIEQYEGKRRVMTDQVGLATLELGLYTDERYVPPTVASQARGTFQRSWNALLAVGNALLLLGIALVPWLPLLALAVWLLRRWLQRSRRRAVPLKA